jgi:hypothetical protein
LRCGAGNGAEVVVCIPMFVRGTTHNLFDLFLDVKYGMMVAV